MSHSMNDPSSSALLEVAERQRQARCSCGRIEPSCAALAFFECRGAESQQAKDACKHCGYYECAHDREALAKITREPVTVIERGLCKGFEPHGAYEFDSFYCGHAGWD